MATYYKGQLVRIIGQFVAGTDGLGSASFVDPVGTITFKYKNPAGTITTLTYGSDAAVVRDAVGEYHCDIDANATGAWAYMWQATGSNQSSTEGSFEVASQF